MSHGFDLDSAIRKVPDFPKEGILFYDITGVLVEPEAFRYCIDQAVERYSSRQVDAVAGIDARGFVFAATIAYRLSVPLILVRKQGKLPGETFSRSFELEYGTDTVEVHKSDVRPGSHVLVVDDLIATGGTLDAAGRMIREAGASVAGIFAVIGLPFLNYEQMLSDYEVTTLIDYHGE
jgi:adenine phosphoribosyltransferase